MCAQILEIDDRLAVIGLAQPRLSNFAYHEGGAIDAGRVLKDRTMSLYCFDEASQRAIFVALPPDVDLSQAPFYLMTQYDEAQYLVALSYDEFFRITDQIQPPEKLIFIQTAGRSGSTLLTRVFNELDEYTAYAEPAAIEYIVCHREPDGSQDKAYLDLVRRCVLATCKDHLTDGYVMKFRAWVMEIADLLYAAFPNARSIFTYRHADTWLASWHRIYTPEGFEQPVDFSWMGTDEELPHMLPALVKFTAGNGKAPAVDGIIANWLSTMDVYLRMHQQGIPMIAIRYADLNQHRGQALKQIFAYCGIPDSQVKAGLRAFARDAHEGTFLEGTSQTRDKPGPPMPRKFLDRLHELLAQHGTLHPDFRVPDTLELGDV